MNTARFVVRSNIICRFTILTLVSLILPISMLGGCGAKLSVFPEVSEYPKQVEVLIRGEIVYEGKPEYRPRTIAGGGDSKLNLYYVYEDSHSRNDPMLTRHGIPMGLQKIGSK